MHFNIKNIIEETNEWNNSCEPLYKKLYNSLKTLIDNKALPDGLKLPPSRLLAKDLKISRSTVNKTLDILLFEQYIVSKQGSGYFVKYQIKSSKGIANKEEIKKFNYPIISKRAKRFLKNQYISTDNFSKKNIAFRPGLPPLDIFPVQKWKQVSNFHWRTATPTSLSYAPSEGIESLRKNISNYLKIYRNINCDYNQIIITSGSLHSLYLLGSVLVNSKDNIIMENPTFPRAYNLFKSIKANIIPCNIDKFGINISSVKAKNVKFTYTTPSNQYPLGIKMSKERRTELLEWASKNNSLIIEDDYDHEFSNWENSIPSLFSLDKEDRVIYIGTFNKLLHPSLRVGYLIAPKYLINPIKAIYEQSSRFVSVHIQETLNTFINKDYLNMHIRKVISVASTRKNDFMHKNKSIFKIDKHFSGLHIIGKFKKEANDFKIHKALLKNNVIAYPLSNYYITKEKQSGLVMGYSSVNEKVMRNKIEQIHRVLKK